MAEIVRRELAGPALEGLHPVLERVYRGRGVGDHREVDYGLEGLATYHSLSGITAAVDLLESALVADQRILVVGDFDADGATGTAVAIRALRGFGASGADYLVPNRFEFGYGLTVAVAEVAIARGPDVLVTVDHGIASHDGVARARAAGARVLVTDHHLAGPSLPAADVIVNPNQPHDAFPSKHLAGVGVVFYVMLALRARLRERGWFSTRPEPNLARLLDLVALGTVADVAQLDRNNRVLVAQGLARVRGGGGQAGIRALMQVAGRDPATASASDLAFGIGPRLNAAGRIEDMSLGVACLLSDDAREALAWARRLDALNRERRAIETEMRADATVQVDAMLALEGELPAAVCLRHDDWHPGVVGIVAARVKEQVARPVIAFAPDGPDRLKGSARTVPGVHVRDLIAQVAASHPDLVERFGGHAAAAGLSIPAAAYDAFARALSSAAERTIPAGAGAGVVWSDGELAPDEIDLTVAQMLRDAGPWGAGFPEPVFDGVFEVVGQRVVGKRHLKLSLAIPGSGLPVDGIYFNPDPAVVALDPVPRLEQVRLAYRLDVNAYRGTRRVQLVIEHLTPDV